MYGKPWRCQAPKQRHRLTNRVAMRGDNDVLIDGLGHNMLCQCGRTETFHPCPAALFKGTQTCTELNTGLCIHLHSIRVRIDAALHPRAHCLWRCAACAQLCFWRQTNRTHRA